MKKEKVKIRHNGKRFVMPDVRSSTLIKQFFEETGYCDCYSELSGVRKDSKKGDNWDFKEASVMLKDFVKWLENYYKI